MPDDLRAELEAAVSRKQKHRKWTLTDELLWRLRASFTREHEHARDPATRDWCDLIAELAKHGHYGRPNWDRDPFWFRTFKLGVISLLDALEPPGEIQPRKVLDPEIDFATPDDQAKLAVRMVLHQLRAGTPRGEFEATVRHLEPFHKDEPGWITDMMDRFDRDQRTFSRLRRNLQLTLRQKKGGKQ